MSSRPPPVSGVVRSGVLSRAVRIRTTVLGGCLELGGENRVDLSRHLEVVEARCLDLNIRHGRAGRVSPNGANRIIDQGQPDSGHLEAAPHDDDDQDKEQERLHPARMRRCVKRAEVLRSGIDGA